MLPDGSLDIIIWGTKIQCVTKNIDLDFDWCEGSIGLTVMLFSSILKTHFGAGTVNYVNFPIVSSSNSIGYKSEIVC